MTTDHSLLTTDHHPTIFMTIGRHTIINSMATGVEEEGTTMINQNITIKDHHHHMGSLMGLDVDGAVPSGLIEAAGEDSL